MTAEHDRLGAEGNAWRHWGPYLSERAWGTAREDYSADGAAWDYFPHDHSRSRAYRRAECRAARPAAHALVPKLLVVGDGCRAPADGGWGSRFGGWGRDIRTNHGRAPGPGQLRVVLRRGERAALHGERDQHAGAVRGAE